VRYFAAPPNIRRAGAPGATVARMGRGQPPGGPENAMAESWCEAGTPGLRVQSGRASLAVRRQRSVAEHFLSSRCPA
jgi:hypothetical protein